MQIAPGATENRLHRAEGPVQHGHGEHLVAADPTTDPVLIVVECLAHVGRAFRHPNAVTAAIAFATRGVRSLSPIGLNVERGRIVGPLRTAQHPPDVVATVSPSYWRAPMLHQHGKPSLSGDPEALDLVGEFLGSDGFRTAVGETGDRCAAVLRGVLTQEFTAGRLTRPDIDRLISGTRRGMSFFRVMATPQFAHARDEFARRMRADIE